MKMRENTLQGNTKNTGWAEWSVEHMSDCNDVELWYRCNPSMGTILTERKVADEVGSDEVDFNIQRLGLWLKYNQKSAITPNEWNKLKIDSMPKFAGKMFVGIKYGHDGENVSMSIAVKTKDSRIYVEAIDCQYKRNGNDWIIQFLSRCRDNIAKIAIDGANGQAILVNELMEEKIKNFILPTTKEVIEANSMFEQGIFEETICHNAQPSLVNAVTNVEKRAIGTNGGFGYKCNKNGVETALVDSTLFAFWLCAKEKEKKKQKARY